MEQLHLKFYITFFVALIPMIMGFIWYNPKVFGNAWMQESGMTVEKARSGNMPKTMILLYIFSCMIAFAMFPLTIHQMGFTSMLENALRNPATKDLSEGMLTNILGKFGNEFRTFKHGALHGTISALFIAMPLFSINALFEQKSVKYVAINVGFWVVCLILMGGVVCAYA